MRVAAPAVSAVDGSHPRAALDTGLTVGGYVFEDLSTPIARTRGIRYRGTSERAGLKDATFEYSGVAYAVRRLTVDSSAPPDPELTVETAAAIART